MFLPCHNIVSPKIYLPVLSVICPCAVSIPSVTPEISLANVNVISKDSSPSTTLSQVTEILALPMVAPASIVMLNASELKSMPDPMYVCTYINMYAYTYTYIIVIFNHAHMFIVSYTQEYA